MDQALPEINLDAIPDAATRRAVELCLNLIERLYAETAALKAENQRLKDDIARLKGEQGRPEIKPNRPGPPPPADHSSERERHVPKRRKKGRKLHRIEIDRTEPLRVDRAALPPDAQFKGLVETVVQDVVVRRDNVRFLREKFYSPSTGRTYLAPLPPGYTGEFGPGVRILALALNHGANVTFAPCRTFLDYLGVSISRGEIANLLTQGHGRFHAEKEELLKAGLASSRWQQTDQTPTRVDGHNEVCNTLGNPLYTIYQTTPTKERMAVLDVLRGSTARTFRLDSRAQQWFGRSGLAQRLQRALAALPFEQTFGEGEFEELLARHLPSLGPQQRRTIREGAAIAAYHAQTDVPVVDTLLVDDAPQYPGLTDGLMLCWVHEGRHYTKLCPYLPRHQELLAGFRKRFWEFYRELLAYQAQPTPEEAERMSEGFDALFSTRTGYDLLDDRIALTRAKKAGLLTVLEHPELPLHNNASELAARRRVRKRDVSFGPRSPEGRQAWDTFQSLAATCAKLSVSFYQYLHDRITAAGRIPRLATLITERARNLDLDSSWGPSVSPGY